MSEGIFGQVKVVKDENQLHASFMEVCSNCGFAGGVNKKTGVCIKCEDIQGEKQMVSA